MQRHELASESSATVSRVSGAKTTRRAASRTKVTTSKAPQTRARSGSAADVAIVHYEKFSIPLDTHSRGPRNRSSRKIGRSVGSSVASESSVVGPTKAPRSSASGCELAGGRSPRAKRSSSASPGARGARGTGRNSSSYFRSRSQKPSRSRASYLGGAPGRVVSPALFGPDERNAYLRGLSLGSRFPYIIRRWLAQAFAEFPELAARLGLVEVTS